MKIFPMSYHELNLVTWNALKSGAEVGTVLLTNFMSLLIFPNFLSLFIFTLANGVFTNVIHDVNVILVFLHLPSVNTLDENFS